MNWELVVFDCDGTLVDSERIANEVFATLITAAGLPTSFEECVARYMGRSTTACLAVIEERLGRAPSADLVAERTRLVDERLAAELVAVPGIPELLARLAAAGLPMCVASSSKPAEIEFRLRRTGLADFFGGNLFSATTVPNGKPAPDVYLLAADKLGADPARCIVVEDSPVGVRGAVAAGMHVVGFADLVAADVLRAAGAHEVVGKPADIAGLLTAATTSTAAPRAAPVAAAAEVVPWAPSSHLTRSRSPWRGPIVARPGGPAARRPGGPAARRPGGPAARRPGSPAARRRGGAARRRGAAVWRDY